MARRKAPSVKEDVTCNLIPMVDIMFLLLLFFLFKNKVSKMCLSINLQSVDMLRHLAANEKAVA